MDSSSFQFLCHRYSPGAKAASGHLDLKTIPLGLHTGVGFPQKAVKRAFIVPRLFLANIKGLLPTLGIKITLKCLKKDNRVFILLRVLKNFCTAFTHVTQKCLRQKAETENGIIEVQSLVNLSACTMVSLSLFLLEEVLGDWFKVGSC